MKVANKKKTQQANLRKQNEREKGKESWPYYKPGTLKSVSEWKELGFWT